jgi:hypothetical protein
MKKERIDPTKLPPEEIAQLIKALMDRLDVYGDRVQFDDGEVEFQLYMRD